MKISRSTGYALLAVGYIAQNQDRKIILSQSIAKEYDIPLEYLLKILQQMVKANVLRSKRGPRGGFSLGKPTTRISMLDVIEAVEGPMQARTCLFGEPVCEAQGCVLSKYFGGLNREVIRKLARTRLTDLTKEFGGKNGK